MLKIASYAPIHQSLTSKLDKHTSYSRQNMSLPSHLLYWAVSDYTHIFCVCVTHTWLYEYLHGECQLLAKSAGLSKACEC